MIRRHSLQTKRGARSGFLLIEALVAVVILSISLTMIIRSMSTSLRATVLSLDYTKAVFLAENKMFDLLYKLEARLPEDREDSFDPPFDKFSYRLTAKDFADMSDSALQDIVLDIVWGQGRKERHLSLRTYVCVGAIE